MIAVLDQESDETADAFHRRCRVLPDEVDGHVLFDRATGRWRAQQEGRTIDVLRGGLSDVVMVPPVREARDRGALVTVPQAIGHLLRRRE